MRTVLLSISGLSDPTDSVAEHKRSSVLIRVLRQVEFYHLVILLFALPKGMHIMLFLPLAFQKDRRRLVPFHPGCIR